MTRNYTVTRYLTTLMLLMPLLAQAATEVGEVSYSSGVLTGQVAGEAPQILGKGFPLHNGETLNTGRNSIAIIELDDGSRMTLRPNTSFKIENVNVEEGNENALMSLLRGGFRAITGFISKKRPDSFRVNTKIATIGIRGTEFDARLCEDVDCDQENRALASEGDADLNVPKRKAIARIALLQGAANAIDGDSQTRALSTGAEIYELDELQTGIKSFAVIAFNDKSRVTLSSESSFKIEEHRYRPEVARENNAFLRFIRGGLRLVTGAIGKLNQKAFRVATPTATIGIRGTGFDLACDGDCVDNTALFNPQRETVATRLLSYFIKPVYAVTGNGMYARVWSGAIEFQYQGGALLLESGGVAFLRNGFTRPEIIDAFPVHLRAMGNAPRPDRLNINEQVFPGADGDEIKPGLYVNVRDGRVELAGADGSKTRLGQGEAGRVGLAGNATKLSIIPPFQKFDPIPNPSQLNPQMQKMIKLFGAKSGDKEGFECRLQ